MRRGKRLAAFVPALLALALTPSPASGEAPLPSPPREVGFDQKLGQQVPLDLTFNDEGGRSVQLKELFGKKPVVLSLVYYDCPMLCGLSLTGLVSTLRGMKFDAGKEFDVLTVSFDPRETSDLAARKKANLLALYHRPSAEAGWRFLTGSESSIKKLTDAVGFRYVWDAEQKQYAHATGLVVLTPDGHVSKYHFGIDVAPKDLRLALIEAADNRIGTPVDQLLLMCFQYNPLTGKYTMVAMNAMKVGGVLTILGLAAFFFGMARRGRRLSQEARA